MEIQPTSQQRFDSGFQVGSWQVAPTRNELSFDAQTVHVEPKVMRVLVCLAQHPGDVVSRQVLMSAVWGETIVTDQVLSRSISVLRKVFGDDPQRPSYIQTIHKRGYRLIAEVKQVSRDRTGRPDPGARQDFVPGSTIPTSPQRMMAWLGAGFAIVLFGLAALLHHG